MGIERRANSLIDSLGNAAADLSKPRFVDRRFIDIICTEARYDLLD